MSIVNNKVEKCTTANLCKGAPLFRKLGLRYFDPRLLHVPFLSSFIELISND